MPLPAIPVGRPYEAADPFQGVDDAILNLSEAFDAVRRNKSPQELRTIAARFNQQINALFAMQDETYTDLLPHNLAQLESWIENITHPDAPSIGRDFLKHRNEAGCDRFIDSNQGALAVYSSYRLGDNPKFINELSLNPRKISVGEDYVFFGTDNHEIFHALQTKAAPILAHTPWNAETKAFIHPEAWVTMIENLAERDANAREALFYALLARSKPELRQKLLAYTVDKLIPLKTMETILDQSTSLQDAVVEAAVIALDANTRRLNHGRTYTDNYHSVAMRNYWNGLVNRANSGTTGIVYIRPEPKDLWEIGNYKVGPNALGKNTLDPRFLDIKRPRIDVAEDLQVLCDNNDIPPLADCMTFGEYLKTQTAEQSLDSPASSLQNPVVGADRQPVMAMGT